MEFARILKAVSDPTRLRIMHLIDRRGPELCVCDMVATLDLPQGTVSRQLMLLRHFGLVAERRESKWVHYSLPRTTEQPKSAILDCLRTCWEQDPIPFARDLEKFDDLHARNAIVRCRDRATED